MGFPQMDYCSGCGRYRLVSPKGYCDACLREALQRVVDVNPDSMRQHPDLEEFDDYAEKWY